MPKISVVVPVYNVEKYINQCLTSLTRQTLHDIEIICVDDCGTDTSMQIVKEFSQSDKRIKIVHNIANSGLSESRNNGIRNSVAPYIMFCDSDDWYALDMCEKMLNAITDANADLAICGTNVVYEADFGMQASDDKYFAINHTGVLTLTQNLQDQCAVCAWNKIYRRDLINLHDVYFPKGLKYEDNFYFNAYCMWVNKIAFVQEKLYNYRRRSGSIMNNTYNVAQKNLDPLKIAIAFFDYAKQHGSLAKITNWFWKNFFYGLFCNTLQYTDKKYHQECYDMAIDFIDKNYFGRNVDLYTNRTIQQIYSRAVFPYKILGGIIKISEQPEKKTIKLFGIQIFKKVYIPKIKVYLAGILVFKRKISQTMEWPHIVIKPNMDDSQILSELRSMPRFTYIPNPGNLGDMLIATATLNFFRKNKIHFSSWRKKSHNKYIVYGGGGIWTADYVRSWKKLLPIFQKAKKVVILPSSFNNCPELIGVLDERFVVFCRERKSYDYLMAAGTKAKIILDHDMAFRMSDFDNKVVIGESERQILNRIEWNNIPQKAYFMRQDRESRQFVKTDLDVSGLSEGFSDSSVDTINFCSALMLNVVNKANVVVTDRLHVAIAGLLLGKEVFMLDNSYGKLSAVYKHSMKQFKNVHFCENMPEI